MKRGVLVLLCLLAVTQFVYAGGILTNTNHSAQFVRMFARNASTEVDAVYYNPAGVVQMCDGLYIALHSQTISQTKYVESSFPVLAGSPKKFQGDVFVPVFPDVYAVYKKGSWAFHFGFGPNAGGGSAEFNDGLPSFEQEIAKLPIGITTQIGMPTSKYSSEIAFKGSSAFYGYQVGASYAVTKKLGVSLGVRYLQAVNTYEGSITNIMVNPTHPVFNPTGAMISASAFFNQLYQATVAMGTPNPVLLGYAKNTADKQVDAKQTGSGVTPIIGVNYQFSDKVSAGIKYELQTALELTNETKVDGSGLFPDGAKSNSDVPAILAGGVAYKPIPKLLLAVSGNYYFDTAVSWESRKVKPDGNTWEAQLGAQYCLTPKWAVSVGYNLAKVSLPDEFQSDLNHNLSSNSFGFGFRWQALKALAVDLGALITLYDEFTESQTSPFGAYDLTYSRDNWDVAIGLCYSLK